MSTEVILANYDFTQLETTKSIVWMAVAAVVALAFSVYSYIQMRKMQKKNRPKAGQIDGTIADEGVSFMDIAGSPHVHPNITDLWNKKSEAIKQKTGGFLGIGKQTQVTGYRYYTNFAAFIGNRIEKFIAINFDNRGWIVHDPTKHPVNMLPINAPNLFGQDAGGVVGNIDIEFGYPQPQQNLAYKQHFDLVSAYPYQSYLVFRGNTPDQPFYFGNSGYMKEMLLWVKRIHVKNDGEGQWYDVKSEIQGSGVFKSSTNEAMIKLVGTRDVPAGVPINISTTVIGGEYGDFNTTRETIFTENGSGLIVPQSALAKFSVDHVFSEGDLTYVYFDDGYEKFEAYLDHADYLDPNWGAHSVEPIPSVVTIESVGFDSIYFIEIRSRIELIDFSITFSSPDSYIFTSQDIQYPLSVGLEYTEVVLLSIVLAKGDTAIVSYKTKNKFYEDYINGGVKSYAAVYPTNMEVSAQDADDVYGDINPIHKIREILTDDTAMAKPEADVNDQNFVKAANRIWDEGLGVSWAIDEKSCINAIEELCYHIEAGIRVNRQTGLYEMVLFRDDWFDEDEIHTIAENKIKDLSLEVMNSDDIVNQLNVTYYDRERIKNSTFSVYENGSILTMGKANAESIEFPYFMNMRNAEIVANWKLKQYSTPAWKGTFTTGWREARKWNRYDLVEITWSKKWQGTVLARIMKMDLGNGLNNEVMIDFEEVVPYSGEMNTSIVVDDSTEEKAEPAKPAIGETFEAPYYIAVQNIGQRKIDEELAHNPDVGFTFSTYRRPQWNALYTEITTINADDPENGWVIDGNAEFVTGGQFEQVVSKTATQISVKNINIEGLFGSGDLIVAGSWLIGADGLYEFMLVEDFDKETNILTVKRGVLDTLPDQWDDDIWFFVSNADDGLFSLTEYSAGDNVRASSLTVTPGSKLEHLGSAPVYMRSRAIRPYPPANVKINGEYWPAEIETDLILTWADRNRLQQTGGEILSWFDGGVTIESGTSTMLTIKELDVDELVVATHNIDATGTNTYTLAISAMQANTRFVKVTLKTMRDGYESYQAFDYTVELSQFFSAPYDLTVEFKND